MEMRKPVPIQTQTGFETWSGSSYDFRAFLCKQPGREFKEEPLHGAAFDAENHLVRTIRQPQQHASTAGRDVSLGQWYTGSYEIEEGSIIKITTSQSAPAWGERRKALQQFIRVRRDAALVKISMDLPDKIGRTIADAHVYGRFDVITLKDAMAAGCRVHPKYHHLFTDTFGDALLFKVVEAAVSAPDTPVAKTIINASGDAELVTVQRRGRAVRSVDRTGS